MKEVISSALAKPTTTVSPPFGIHPALAAESTNVVNANAPRPSGAGSAICCSRSITLGDPAAFIVVVIAILESCLFHLDL